ncbi:MAG: AbiV family abortive infection protein [Candidatus Paceibacterota bacterium]
MNKNLNLKKIEKISTLAFDNGLRLHFDSILLFFNKSWPSAFHLSILAMEEFGKAKWCDSFVFYTSPLENRDAEEENKWLKLLYNHREKQCAFIEEEIFNYPPKFFDLVKGGGLEKAKQYATYVGLRKNKDKIEISGKIYYPQRIRKEKSKRQITLINDYLLDLISGKISGKYLVDNEKTESKLNRKLLNKLKSIWPHQNKKRDYYKTYFKKWKKLKT